MSFTYDLSTPVGQIRLLIPDSVNTDAEGSIFSDEELTAFLGMDGVSGNNLRAAAYACLSIARDNALVQKVQKVKDVETDGAKLSAEFRQHSNWLMAEALRVEAGDGGDFVAVRLPRPRRRGIAGFEGGYQ